jgi:hypothetical protein
MGRQNGCFRAWQDERQTFGIIPVRLDTDERGFNDTRPAPFRSPTHRAGQITKRQESLIIGPGKPSR